MTPRCAGIKTRLRIPVDMSVRKVLEISFYRELDGRVLNNIMFTIYIPRNIILVFLFFITLMAAAASGKFLLILDKVKRIT